VSTSKEEEVVKPKVVTSWDVRIPQPPTNLSTGESKFISISSSKETFSSTTLINKQSIEIKLPSSASQASDKTKEDPKAGVYGKWEAYKPQTDKEKPGGELGKFMKMCQEISAKEGYEDCNTESSTAEQVHHPFSVKEAPLYTPPPIRSRMPVPTNPAQAIMQGSLNSLTAAQSGPLEQVFPVSSGTDHQKVYKETATDENAGVNTRVFEDIKPQEKPKVNVSAVIARRLGAQQILSSKPNDYAAQLVLTECDQKLKAWSSQSKAAPGKFTGEINPHIRVMDKKQMWQAPQPALQKDFFHHLQPVNGGIGKKMLLNMGWKEGQAIGKNKEGFTTPIAVDLKVGRQGLYAEDEMPKLYVPPGGSGGGVGGQYSTPTNMGMMQPRRRPQPIVNVNGKHPVSALAEHCTKGKMGMPEYSVVMEGGTTYSKTFVTQVVIQNVAYQPTEASTTKKHAKAMAAQVALKALGMLP